MRARRLLRCQDIEWHYRSYEAALKRHKLKTVMGTIEDVVTVPFEVLENLAKGKLAALARIPFTLLRKRVDLLDEEASPEGKEIAYLVDASERFS